MALYQAQAQILSLQGEKLDGLFKAAKDELDALMKDAPNEANE